MFNRRIPTWILLLILVLNIVFLPSEVLADKHTLENLEIFVYVNEDGSARVLERRNAYLTEGTENYIVIGNLGDSDIKDFRVRENGILYEHQSYWDTDAPREEKAYKSGIVTTSDGYELCWGIGEYGRHAYEVEYTITNFVKQYQDRQGIFWRFVNDKTNIPPETVNLVLEGDREFFTSNSNIWAFGYEGYIQFDKGKILAYSSEAFDRTDYLTILVEMEQGMYNTTSIIDKPFEEIKDKAFEGSDYGADTSSRRSGFIEKFIGGIGFNLLIILLAIWNIISKMKKDMKTNHRRSYKRKFKGEYYRDYPYEEDFIDAYYILNNIRVADSQTLITGFILKWINKGWIIPEKAETGRIFKKEETALRFVRKDMDRYTVEGQLFNMMLDAAGLNEVLESNEFTSWAKKNHRKLNKWEEEAKEESLRILQEKEYVEFKEKKRFIFKSYDFVLTEKGEVLEERVHKFVNYLHDFSLLNEHEAINVGIWDNLMIWAGVLGITEVVAKEFKKLYPNYEAESVYRGNSIYAANTFSRGAFRASTTRSGGGGGFSSSGGGGGSSGGGSGGGTR